MSMFLAFVFQQSEVDEEMDDGDDDDSDTYDILGVLSAINITDRKVSAQGIIPSQLNTGL